MSKRSLYANKPEKSIEVPEVIKTPQWARPAQVVIDCTFEEKNRKVTPADLERAAQAAAAAFRATLENRTPTYSIAEIDVTVSYSYVQSKQTFSA